MFEYRHTWIEADRNDQKIQDRLNDYGRGGLELVAIVPDHVWEQATVSQDHEYQGEGQFGPDALPTTYTVEAPYAMPVEISGWYCTFKRSI